MTDGPSDLSTLDALSTEQLREQAFSKAEKHADVGFFWGLFKRLPANDDIEAVDGSAGGYGEGISDLVGLWRQWTQHEYGDREPLYRAAFIDYLRTDKDAP